MKPITIDCREILVIKNEIRKSVLRARTALSPAEVTEKSALVIEKVLLMKEYLQAGTIMVYLDFRNEVQTGHLVQHSLSAGKRVTVPVTDVANHKLIPSLLQNYPDDLQPGTWGILEPKPDCLRSVNPAEIDLVFVPGVAFDLSGNRVGYGGGFYDRFLLQTRPHTFYIALAFELQIKPYVYPDEHDIPVHWIVTENRLIRTAHP